jgi:hypothetical protein
VLHTHAICTACSKREKISFLYDESYKKFLCCIKISLCILLFVIWTRTYIWKLPKMNGRIHFHYTWQFFLLKLQDWGFCILWLILTRSVCCSWKHFSVQNNQIRAFIRLTSQTNNKFQQFVGPPFFSLLPEFFNFSFAQ